MSTGGEFHVLGVGWHEDLGREIGRRSGIRLTYVAHPRLSRGDFAGSPPADTLFFRRERREEMPQADRALLATLERDDVPSVHNMILGDRVLAKLPYETALRYATFLARRLLEIIREVRPTVVISSYDSLHSALALAVARQLKLPWFALNFSVIPPGYACFCDTLLPVSRVTIAPPMPNLRELAEGAMRRFEERSMHVPAYVTPPALSPLQMLGRLPPRFGKLLQVLRAAREREHLQYTEEDTDYDLGAALTHLWRARAARRAAASVGALARPPQRPFVLFGLHTQPESAIDVWAPFYSDQFWVVQLLARALPPTHSLLVKVHKSDAAKYSRADLMRIKSTFGVELVSPTADSRAFVDAADMIISIQGTMGLEGALLGKPVLMLGDSPVNRFPSAERIGELTTLPAQMRRLLARPRAPRAAILDAFVEFLVPFRPAAHNDWTISIKPEELQSFADMFVELRTHLSGQPVKSGVASG